MDYLGILYGASNPAGLHPPALETSGEACRKAHTTGLKVRLEPFSGSAPSGGLLSRKRQFVLTPLPGSARFHFGLGGGGRQGRAYRNSLKAPFRRSSGYFLKQQQKGHRTILVGEQSYARASTCSHRTITSSSVSSMMWSPLFNSSG